MQLPERFGPGSLSRVLRQAVQAFVNSAVHEKAVFNLLKEGTNKLTVTGTDAMLCTMKKGYSSTVLYCTTI